jgi:hypothetical protein
MTIDKDKTVKIPVWLIVVILPLVISVGAAITTSQINMASTKRQVEVNTKVLEQKANQGEFEIIKAQLNRIETKIDKHIEK